MRKFLLCSAILLAAGCSDATRAPVPATVVVSTPVPMNALGTTQVVRAVVHEGNAKVIPNAIVTWHSSSPAVTVAGAGDSAVVTSVANGTAVITATAGPASSWVEVKVAQEATAFEKLDGDGQAGRAGRALEQPIRVRVRDGNGAPVAGHNVSFEGDTGSLAAIKVATDVDGIAANVWTLPRKAGAHRVRAVAVIAGGFVDVAFTATASVGPPAAATAVEPSVSGWPARPLPGILRLRVTDDLGTPLPNVAVRWEVTSGGGKIGSGDMTMTDAEGLAYLWDLTLGPRVGSNTLTATLPGTSLAPVVFIATARQQVFIRPYTPMYAAAAGTQVPAGPAVAVTNHANERAPGVRINFTVASGGGSVRAAQAITDQDGLAHLPGWVLGAAPGINTLTATAPADHYDAQPVTLRAVGCSGGSGTGFGIALCITSGLSASQRAAFEGAAARWARIIRGDLPDVHSTFEANHCGNGSPRISQTFDDLVIFAAVRPIDGKGTVLGRAGWCARRADGLPMLGVMEFDEADVGTLEERDQLGSVILHEMGHVLGIGTLWSDFGLLQNPSSSSRAMDTYFSGAGALSGFDAIGGTTYTRGMKVPVENMGGAGSINGHWRESVLGSELMTSVLSNASNPLSALTVRSLADLGYTVDANAGDSFSLALAASANRLPGGSGTLRIHDDAYTGPRYTVDRSGRRTRIR